MDGLGVSRGPEQLIGIAGRPVTAEEKSFVRQAVFLLRYRMRVDGIHQAALPDADPARSE